MAVRRGYILSFILAALLIIPLTTASSFAATLGVSGSITLDSTSVACDGVMRGQINVVNNSDEQLYVRSVDLSMEDTATSQSMGGDRLGYAVTVPVGGSVDLPFTISQKGGTTKFDPEPANLHAYVDYDSLSNKQRTLELSKDYFITGCPIHQDGKILPGSGSSSDSPTKSNCLIATAAFGSDIAPQVQFLRVFRDQNILSTAAGSSFMNVFNTWYYSFSPSVADYERGQPWMQQTVRTSIYPLLGMLTLSQDAYSVLPGEYGAISAGLIASSLIGATYFSPFALAIKQVRKYRLDPRLAIGIVSASVIAVIISVIAANDIALMASTSLLVLTTLSISAVYSADAINRAIGRLGNKNSGATT